MFGDAEHYKYLTNEADLNNVVDDSIALTPKTPKREDNKLTAASPQTPIDAQAIQQAAQEKARYEAQLVQQQQAQEKAAAAQVQAISLGNMSMAESMDASFYNSVKNVHSLEADNIPVEARPKAAG